MICLCCGESPVTFRWTDCHGVAICNQCGMPYRLLHYQDNRPVQRPAEPMLTPEGIEIARRYWTERGRMVFPGEFDIVARGTTYSGATSEDIESFSTWYAAEYPPGLDYA